MSDELARDALVKRVFALVNKHMVTAHEAEKIPAEKAILALVQREVAADLRRMLRALCRSHDRTCLLDNGRVWGLCGGRRLIDGGIPEEEVVAAIRAEEPRDGRPRRAGAMSGRDWTLEASADALMAEYIRNGEGDALVKQALLAALAAAFRSGAEQMRERAALECIAVAHAESERTLGRPTTGEYQIGARNCAIDIRTLPVEEPRG